MVVYNDFHPSTIDKSYFAYIKKKGEKVLAIQEKKPFTKNPINEYTSSGTYYFKNKEILENCLIIKLANIKHDKSLTKV